MEAAVTKEIPHFPGYFVDTNGCVYSNLNKDKQLIVKKLHHKKSRSSGQYCDVNLYQRSINGKGRGLRKKVHHLVLETFVGPRPINGVARHLNDNSLDNHLSNLKWGNQKENSDDFFKNFIIKSDFFKFVEKKYPDVIKEFNDSHQ